MTPKGIHRKVQKITKKTPKKREKPRKSQQKLKVPAPEKKRSSEKFIARASGPILYRGDRRISSSRAQSRAKLQARRAPRSLKTWKYFTFSMTSKVESTLWGASRQLLANSCANYVKKSELWHKSYVSSLTFDVKILKIVGNEQNQTRYGPPVCLLYPDTATLPAWCWPKIFKQKTYNFNLDFDILCVKLNLKTYFITIFKSYKNSRCFAYADLGGQSDPQTVALAAIKRQTLSGTKNLWRGVFHAFLEQAGARAFHDWTLGSRWATAPWRKACEMSTCSAMLWYNMNLEVKHMLPLMLQKTALLKNGDCPKGSRLLKKKFLHDPRARANPTL